MLDVDSILAVCKLFRGGSMMNLINNQLYIVFFKLYVYTTVRLSSYINIRPLKTWDKYRKIPHMVSGFFFPGEEMVGGTPQPSTACSNL